MEKKDWAIAAVGVLSLGLFLWSTWIRFSDPSLTETQILLKMMGGG